MQLAVYALETNLGGLGDNWSEHIQLKLKCKGHQGLVLIAGLDPLVESVGQLHQSQIKCRAKSSNSIDNTARTQNIRITLIRKGKNNI